jgi:glyoxylate/hydroxypyruvate reductase
MGVRQATPGTPANPATNPATVVVYENAAEWIERLTPLLPGETLLTTEQALLRVDDIDAAIVDGTAAGLGVFPNIRFVQSTWMGADRIIAEPELPKGAVLARMVAGTMTASMTEFVVGSVLYIHRRFPDYLAQQSKREWIEHFHPVASDCPVGILGAGTLGAASAAMLRAVGFPVRSWARTPRADDPTVLTGANGLTELLATSSVLVNLLPLTPQTQLIINREFLAQCRAGVGLINAGRGKHIDDDALLDALDSGQVGHAVLDVFTIEPLPGDHRYWTHPRVTLMPHVAAASTGDEVAESTANGVRAYRSGSVIPNLVDGTRGY